MRSVIATASKERAYRHGSGAPSATLWTGRGDRNEGGAAGDETGVIPKLLHEVTVTGEITQSFHQDHSPSPADRWAVCRQFYTGGRFRMIEEGESMTLLALSVAIVLALLIGITFGVLTARDASSVLRDIARRRNVSVLDAWREVP